MLTVVSLFIDSGQLIANQEGTVVIVVVVAASAAVVVAVAVAAVVGGCSWPWAIAAVWCPFLLD